MRRQVVLGNWKMNGSTSMVETLLDGILSGFPAENKADIGVCVPFVYLKETKVKLAGSSLLLGAQNVSEQASGAYTGEVSAEMLVDCGCALVLVGHSERRTIYGESNELVAAKFEKAVENGLTPVLCVGETLEEREAGRTFEVIEAQLNSVLCLGNPGKWDSAIVAYEPVWAIGTGKTASAEQAQEVHDFIRKMLLGRGVTDADSVRILYGGSVKPDNSEELFAMPDIDGGLIGGASLDADSFLAIYGSTQVVE